MLLLFFILYNVISTLIFLNILMDEMSKIRKLEDLNNDLNNELAKIHKK